MYNIEFDRKVEKFLNKTDDKTITLFLQKLEILKANPFENQLDIKKLKGKFKNCYRLRVGKYRFLYEILEDKILIYFFDANSRGDIY